MAAADRSTPGIVSSGRRSVAASCMLAAVSAAWAPASAQTLAEARDAMEIMVGSAAICSDYLERPEILEDMRGTGLGMLTGAGMTAGEAETFMDEVTARARAETTDETQKQVACEIINIPAIK